MKRLTTILAALIFLCGTMFAQTTTDAISASSWGNGKLLSYAALTLDSAETTWSGDFQVNNNDDFSYSTYPWHVGYDLAAADSVNISCYWYVSFDNVNWVLADTLFAVTSSAAASGAKTTNALDGVKAPHNKIKVVNNTGSKANTLVLGIYQPVGD